MHQLPDNAAKTVDKPLIRSFQLGNGLLFLRRYMGGFLEEAPTPLPQRLGEFNTVLIVLCFPPCLELATVGSQRFFEVPPDILDRMEMVGLQAGLRIDRFNRLGEAL
jgi:hypothetical protein